MPLALLAPGTWANAQERDTQEHEPGATAAPAATDDERKVLLFPTGDPYPPNTPDPHRRTNGVQLVSVDEADIADSGTSRFQLNLGGRFGILRVHGSQLGIEAGFRGQFDNDNSQDNIGWDGYYGLVLTRGFGPRLAWKAGVVHTSAHIGDELIERTGRERIGYTREELLTGVSYRLAAPWRLYAEAAWAYTNRNEEVQEPGRAQLGLVFERRDSLFSGRAGWYAGADLSAWQERDWELDLALQIGLVFASPAREWRFGVERYSGRPPLGEFFFADEDYTAVGLWLDFS